jgi:hypothetical protein
MGIQRAAGSIDDQESLSIVRDRDGVDIKIGMETCVGLKKFQIDSADLIVCFIG